MGSWFWWALGTFGVGGLLLGGAILIFGWPVVIGSKIGRIAIAIGAGVLAVFGMYLKAKAEGRAEERAKLKAQIEKEVGKAAVESKRIDNLSDEELDKELSKWDVK